MSPMTSVPTDDLRVLFDTAVNSMDFGSGFLDDSEVEVLRRIAVLLGVDPMEATPSVFAAKYPHAFHAYRFKTAPPSLNCSRCGKTETEPPHHEAADTDRAGGRG